MNAVDTAAQAWMTALDMFAASQPGGFHKSGPGGTTELVTTAPMPLLNGIFSTARKADAEEVAAFASSPRLASVAWSVQVRGEEVDTRIVRTAADHGLLQRMTLPFMLRKLSGDDMRGSNPDGLVVRRISAGEGDLYRTTMAAGYEGPAEIFSVFSVPSLIEHPSMRAYLGEVESVPVATSFGVLVDDLVGVFNIAVPPSHRRHGYGRAATAAVLSDAYAAGARTAFLHASPMGAPLYQAMGFDLAEYWTIFAP
ncbi:GNAT family N-acetyltransferase [Nonomuraea jabiensis]|uniref:GNAT family N-acetyltransferase n=1 Tax=Nonomuraea jabiensis TaxID=882448 RepID=UPI0036B2D350